MIRAEEEELEILDREQALNNHHLLGLKGQMQKAKVANKENVAEVDIIEDVYKMNIKRIGSLRQEDSTLRCKPESIQNSWNDVKDKREDLKANNETLVQPELTQLKEMKDSFMTNLKIVINGRKHDEEVVATLILNGKEKC